MKHIPTSICIFRLSALGDVTHMLPVIHTLQRTYPDTKITWIIGKLEVQLVKNIPGIEFIIFDKSKGLQAYTSLWKTLRGRKFDILLMMQVALRASIASLGIRAEQRIGFDRDRSRDGQHLFCNAVIPENPRTHVLDGFFDFLRAIGIEQRVMQWDLPVDPEAHTFAEQYIQGQPTLVINPCTSARANNFRNWRAEYYAAVADYAAQRYQLQTILTGGPADAEKEMAEQIIAAADSPVVSLVGNTTIQQMLAVLQQASLIIAPDTGPAHMGTAVGTPVIGLYVTSNPERTGPYNSRHLTVNRYPNAVKKYLHQSVEQAKWGQRVRHADAIDLITVEDVTRQLDRFFSTEH